MQVRGLITVFSHQPDNSSVTTTGLILESLDALASGNWILIGRGKKKEAQVSRAWRTRAGQWKIDIVGVKLAL